MPAIHAAKARVERSRRGGWCTSRCALLCKPHLRKQQGGLSDLVWIMGIKHPGPRGASSLSSKRNRLLPRDQVMRASHLTAQHPLGPLRRFRRPARGSLPPPHSESKELGDEESNEPECSR